MVVVVVVVVVVVAAVVANAAAAAGCVRERSDGPCLSFRHFCLPLPAEMPLTPLACAMRPSRQGREGGTEGGRKEGRERDRESTELECLEEARCRPFVIQPRLGRRNS